MPALPDWLPICRRPTLRRQKKQSDSDDQFFVSHLLGGDEI
jgi:hypothetical protein